eukprot:11361-Heterococcus_DN1.PRE.2
MVIAIYLRVAARKDVMKEHDEMLETLIWSASALKRKHAYAAVSPCAVHYAIIDRTQCYDHASTLVISSKYKRHHSAQTKLLHRMNARGRSSNSTASRAQCSASWFCLVRLQADSTMCTHPGVGMHCTVIVPWSLQHRAMSKVAL